MQITIIRNRFGHLHVFKGNCEGQLTDTGSNVKYNGKESDVYLQVDTDIQAVKEMLSFKQLANLEAGWEVVIEDFGLF